MWACIICEKEYHQSKQPRRCDNCGLDKFMPLLSDDDRKKLKNTVWILRASGVPLTEEQEIKVTAIETALRLDESLRARDKES